MRSELHFPVLLFSRLSTFVSSSDSRNFLIFHSLCGLLCFLVVCHSFSYTHDVAVCAPHTHMTWLYVLLSYNAIHDPTIGIVATAAMTEGALDIISCAQLMQLAEFNLPSQVGRCGVPFAASNLFLM